ncbi:MAG: hypothetical protein K6F29_08360 [Bacteroidales bacterium]|nr:hypothetical protein [Bacteroidales bacterium]
MEEKIIVSLTSYGERLNNLPVVLDTIYAQTLPPDLVVLNLAYEEVLPKEVEDYLRIHHAEINRVVDTKVYKKIIPTLKKYPDDCIIGIDDDWLYPPQMIEDFMNIHKKYPNNPISGNKFIYKGMQCHCGCASLVKKEYFGEYLDLFDNDIYVNCKSDDVFYTYCAAKNNIPYVRTQNEYFLNMKSFNSIESYSENNLNEIEKSFEYLINNYGNIDSVVKNYFSLPSNEEINEIIYDIEQKYRLLEYNNALLFRKYNSVLNSSAFKLGCFLLQPIYFIKKIFNK